MARARKRHQQQALRFGSKRGGKRPGAGRPPKGPRSSERHEKRESFRRYEPAHVVVRVADAIGELRTRQMYQAIRKALVSTFVRDDFRVVHLSIQNTHVHLIVESENRTALARGMQALQISAARHLNTAISKRRGKRRRGTVFIDRYHAKIIRSPRQARNALAYVLNNWRKHREDRNDSARKWILDPYSTAVHFDGWRDYRVGALPMSYEPLPVWPARCWLLKDGWRKHGLLRTHEVPSQKHAVAAE